MFNQLKQDLCPDGDCEGEEVAEVIKEFFRSDNYIEMAKHGIADALVEEIECQNDSDCRSGSDDSGPEDIFEWLEWEYQDHLGSETHDMRDQYYELLRQDIAEMVTQRVPAHLLADILEMEDDEITDEWRNEAEKSVY